MEDRPTLADLRGQISQITRDIIRLAGKRTNIAREVGKIKRVEALPIEAESVEDSLVREVIAECDRVGLDRRTGLRILNALLSDSKNAQGMSNRPTPGSALSKALELQRRGVKVVRLDVGEPDFRPPRSVLKACSDALFSFKTHYTESRGIPELRSALVRYLAIKHRFKVTDEEIMVAPSGRFAVYAALSTVVGPGEGAIVIEPNWPAYADSLRQLGARPNIVHTTLEQNWTPDVGEIEEAVRPNTKAIVLSYPCNPTGRVIPTKLFREIVGLADDLGLTVISDEIYNEYSSVPCPSILKTTPKKFILTSSFSKTWSMTGFRIGYAVSSAEVISKMSGLASLIVTSVPEFIQWGAIKALTADADARRNVGEMRDRVEAACKALDTIPSIEYSRPDGAMYVFPGIKSGETGAAFSDRLIEKGVTVTPGTAFGDYEAFFRISLGQRKSVILEGIKRMGALLS
jgi:aspartate aminotransferase